MATGARIARRHDPAGRRLYRGKRPVRQHRRPPATGACAPGFAPGEAKENWAILRALSAELGATLPWDSWPPCGGAGQGASASGPGRRGGRERLAAAAAEALGKADFRNAIKDFYLTNPIARALA